MFVKCTSISDEQSWYFFSGQLINLQMLPFEEGDCLLLKGHIVGFQKDQNSSDKWGVAVTI